MRGGVTLPAIAGGGRGGVVAPSGAGSRRGSLASLTGSTASFKKPKEAQTKLAHIRFQPASPGQVLQMAAFLGVDPSKEFYLLPTVKRAVAAPFPSDWAVGHDQQGEVYYYNKYTMKVMAVHPLSDVFIGWVQEERRLKEEELAAATRERCEPLSVNKQPPNHAYGPNVASQGLCASRNLCPPILRPKRAVLYLVDSGRIVALFAGRRARGRT